MNTVKMYRLRDRKPSCSDSGIDSNCTADEYDSMGSTGDSSKKRMRGGVKREAGQKEEAAIPLQKSKKKSRGRVKIDIEFIENTLKRRKTFSKRKNSIINKVKELAKLTGTQVLLMVASETGHLYTFASDKLQPVLTSEAGKTLIQSCLDSPLDSPPPHDDADAPTDATGFKEKMDLTFQASESESLGSTNDESKPSCNNVVSLPGSSSSSSTTTSSISSSTMVLITSTTSTVQEGTGLQVQQQHSQAPMSSLPMEGHMMYPSPPHTVIYNVSQGPCDFQVSHEELMEFALSMCTADSSL